MNEDKKIKLHTFLFALLLNLNNIPSALGVNGIFILALLFCYIIATYGNAFKRNKGINLVVLVDLFCLLSILVNDGSGDAYTTKYLIYGLSLGLFLFSVRLHYDTELTLKYTVCIALVLAPLQFVRSNTLAQQVISNDVDSGVMMGLSYAIIPSLLSAMYLVLRKVGNIWKMLALMLIISDYILLFKVGSRGCYVVLLVAIALYIIIKFVRSYNIRIATIAALGVIGQILYRNIISILEFVNSFLNTIGIQIYAIEKILFLYSLDKIDNGRNTLTDIAIDGFIESPLGHFIGTFEQITDSYTHNIVLQFAWDFGIIGLIFICFIYFFSLKHLLSLNVENEKIDIYLVIFCSSMIMLLYSSTFWYLPCFWLWLKFILNKKEYETNTYI